MKRILRWVGAVGMAGLLAGRAGAQQNLIPNGDFSAKDPLKDWRIDFPHQSQYEKNASYIKPATQLGRPCVEVALPPGLAGNQGGKVESALVPAVPGATYKVAVDCLTWSFSAKVHAEAYVTDPRPNGRQGTSIFVIPATNGIPARVMAWRAQVSDPPAGGKKWATVSREFTLPATVTVAGKECKPEFLVLKAVVYAATMDAGQSYFTNFRLYRVK